MTAEAMPRDRKMTVLATQRAEQGWLWEKRVYHPSSLICRFSRFSLFRKMTHCLETKTQRQT